MPFQKGKSGNPGGRPKVTLPDGTALTDLARQHTPEAVATLVAIARNKKADAKARVMASNSLLDRGWGKPAQHIEVSGAVGLAAELEAARRRIATLEYGEPIDVQPFAIEERRLLPAPVEPSEQ